MAATAAVMEASDPKVVAIESTFVQSNVEFAGLLGMMI